MGGIKRIARVADLLVPVKTLAYIAVTLYVIVLQFDHAPLMLLTIVKSAFGLDQAFDGLIGSEIVMGVKRGVFANEAGLGSAPNVAAVAEVRHPVSQGVVQAFSVLTQNSLAAVVGDWGRSFISVALALFVFTSILYNYYLGEHNLRFILGKNRKALLSYRALVLALIFWGSVQDLSTVFAFADITMTLSALVNLIALVLLCRVGLRLLADYDAQRKAGVAEPILTTSAFLDLDIDRTIWSNAPEQVEKDQGLGVLEPEPPKTS